MDTTTPLMGRVSAKWRTSRLEPPYCGRSGNGIASDANYILMNESDYWGRTYVKFTRVVETANAWPRSFQKWIEMFNGIYYLQPFPHSRLGNGRDPDEFNAFWGATGRNHGFRLPGGLGIESGRWYAVEFHFRSAERTAFDVWVDGEQVYRSSPPGRGGEQAFLFGVINACSDRPWDVTVHMDALALATQRIMPSTFVEICNEPTYDGCTTRFPLEVTRISETALTATFQKSRGRMGTLKRGPGFLYVTNNARQRSAGFPITIS
jgi:hypothetical protein